MNSVIPVLRLIQSTQNQETYLNNLQSLDNQCFTGLDIYSETAFDFEITVIDNCSNGSFGQLFVETTPGSLEPLPIQPQDLYYLLSVHPQQLPGVDGFRRYFLGSNSACCKLNLVPATPTTWKPPEKVRVYDCEGNPPVEYTSTVDIERFFTGQICFNSFALAPFASDFYGIQVSVTACDVVPDDGLWCYTFDLTTSQGDFVIQTGSYSGGINAGNVSDGTRIYRYFEAYIPAPNGNYTSVEMDYDMIVGSYIAANKDRIWSPNGSAPNWIVQRTSGSVGSGSLKLTWTGSIDNPTSFGFVAVSGYNPGGSGSAKLNRVTMRGTGTNPFGTDNCP